MRKSTRLLAILLSVLMIVSVLPVSAFAADNVITAVDTADLVTSTVFVYNDNTNAELRWSSLTYNEVAEPKFAPTLTATVDGVEKELEIQWSCTNYNSKVPGTYTFVATAPGYEWECEAPVITVEVVDGAVYGTSSWVSYVTDSDKKLNLVVKGTDVYDTTGYNLLASGVTSDWILAGQHVAPTGLVGKTVPTETSGMQKLTVINGKGTAIVAGNRNIPHKGDRYVYVNGYEGKYIIGGGYARSVKYTESGNTTIDLTGKIVVTTAITSGGFNYNSSAKITATEGTVTLNIFDLDPESSIASIKQGSGKYNADKRPLIINLDDTSKDLVDVIAYSDLVTVYINDEEWAPAADYTAVTEAIAKIPADLSVYTDETAQAVTAAKNAVDYSLNAKSQTVVDGYATAIEAAVAGLKFKPTGITLDKTELTLAVGSVETLVATIAPEDADTTVVWSTDAEGVAKVEGGVVTAVGGGVAKITATTVSGLTATCVVTVDAGIVLPKITEVDTVDLVMQTVIPYSDVTDTANRWSHFVNTVIEEPDFYQTLDVTVGGEAKTVDVDWVSSDYKYNVAGTYTFTAVADGYVWGCEAPVITVKVIDGAYSTNDVKVTGLISAETNGIPVVYKGDSGVEGRLNQIYDATGCNVLVGAVQSNAGVYNKVYAYPGISASVTGTGANVKSSVYTGKTTGDLYITFTDGAHALILAAGNHNRDHEGNTYITVKNSFVGTGAASGAGIFGGAYANGKTVVTKGDTYIDVSGLVNIDNIFGGGREEDGGAKSSLDGTAYVTIHDLEEGSRIGKITRKANRNKGEATYLVVNLDTTSEALKDVVVYDEYTTIYINGVEYIPPADYTAVTEAIAKIPADLTVYTDETVKAVTDAKNAVDYSLNAKSQTVVNGYAAAIEAAVEGLKLKPVTLNKATLTLAIDEEATLVATLSPENAEQTVEWSVEGDAVKVEDGKVTALKSGTATVKATVSGFTAECVVTVKEMPTCTAPTGLTATYGQTLADVTLSNPTGNTAGSWAWKDSTTSVGDVGEKTFKATFTPEDNDKYVTVDVDVTVTVEAKSITVSVADIADQEYIGSQITPVVTVEGDGKTLVLDTDYTVEYDTNVNAGEGSVTVRAKGNYTFDPVTKTFNITKKAGTVSISGDLNVPYGTEVPDVTIDTQGSDGTTNAYYYTNADCTEGETTTKPTAIGDYWVKVKMEAGTNFEAAESNVLNFTISRADITPAVSITGWTYKDSANDPSVTGNMGSGAVTYTYKVKGADDSTYSVEVPTNAGEYTVKAEIAQTTNYNGGTATADFTITAKALTEAMIDVASQAYTGSEIKPVPVVTDGTVLVNGADYTYGYENNTYVGVAKINVTGMGNYSGTVAKEFNITAIDQTPVITATTFVTKNGKTVDLKPLVTNAMGDVSFAISGEANGCTINDGVLTSGATTGDVTIKVTISAYNVGGDEAPEYKEYSADAIIVTVNDKENQAALNITSATTVTYGQTLTLTSEGGSGTGAVTYVVTNGTGEATIDGNVLTPSKVGTVTVIATKAEDTTYNEISSVPVEITIEKIKVDAPVADETVYTYNGTEQTYQLAGNAAYTITGNKQTNANETGYTVTVALNNTDTHAWTDGSIEVKTYTFVIKKANIAITASDKSIYTGSSAPVLGEADYTVVGLVNGETLKTAPTIEYEATPDTNTAGTTVIKVHSAVAPDGGNYNDIVYTNGTLTVRNAPSYGGGGGITRYTVEFESNGGTNVASVEIRRNAVVEVPEAPTKDGYTFDGWYTDKALTEIYDFTTLVTKNFTLYAKWTKTEKEPVVDEPDTTSTFTDVKENDWFYANVQYAVENNLMNGVSKDKFAPNATLTRAMLVTVLYRNAGEPAVDKNSPFADVDMDAWYADAVVWAKENGIVNGVTENEFAPDENITREQIAAIMFRYAKYKGYDVSVDENTDVLSYEDAESISEYAVSAMNWAVGSGLMKGKSATTINAKDNAIRAEIAAILQRFVENNK